MMTDNNPFFGNGAHKNADGEVMSKQQTLAVAMLSIDNQLAKWAGRPFQSWPEWARELHACRKGLAAWHKELSPNRVNPADCFFDPGRQRGQAKNDRKT